MKTSSITRTLRTTITALLFAGLAPACSTTASNTCHVNADCATSTAGKVCSPGGVCVVCAAASDCPSGMKCDVGGAACVGCVTSADCGSGMVCSNKNCKMGCDSSSTCPMGQVCDLVQGACVGCVADKDCSGATPRCDLGSRTCVACASDGDCMAGQVCGTNHACAMGCSGAHPSCPGGEVCNIAAGACVACLSDGDCKGGQPRCDTHTNTCVACLSTNDNCATGSYCSNEMCVTGCRDNTDCTSPTGQCDVGSHSCVQCVDDTPCAAGQICVNKKCAAGCDGQHACPGGQGCCTGACATLASDNLNCGACGNVCATGTSCCGGTCISITSVANCGTCGNACGDVINGARACVSGKCAIAGCNGSFHDCNSNYADGCETDTSADIKNCGACGNACATVTNATTLGCAASKCNVTGCATGFKDCNLTYSDGCEVDTTKDAKNCGACGNVCDAGASCVSGVCLAPASCAAILTANPQSPDGIYKIDPDGTGPSPTIQVRCDMTNDGGGWTLCAALTKGYVPADMLYNQSKYAFQARLNNSNNYAYEIDAPGHTANMWANSETLNYGQFCRLMGTGVGNSKVVQKTWNYANNCGATLKGAAYDQTHSAQFTGNVFMQWFNNSNSGTFSHVSGDNLCVCSTANGMGGPYIAKSVSFHATACGGAGACGQPTCANFPYTHSDNAWGNTSCTAFNNTIQCVGCTAYAGCYSTLPYGQTAILNNLAHSFWAGIPNLPYGWSDCTANGDCNYHESGMGVWLFYVK